MMKRTKKNNEKNWLPGMFPSCSLPWPLSHYPSLPHSCSTSLTLLCLTSVSLSPPLFCSCSYPPFHCLSRHLLSSLPVGCPLSQCCQPLQPTSVTPPSPQHTKYLSHLLFFPSSLKLAWKVEFLKFKFSPSLLHSFSHKCSENSEFQTTEKAIRNHLVIFLKNSWEFTDNKLKESVESHDHLCLSPGALLFS